MTTSASAKRINRADLLRALQPEQNELLPVTAELCGFKAPDKPKIQLKVPFVSLSPTSSSKPKTAPTPESPKKPNQQPKAHYYRVIDRKQSEVLPNVEEDEKPQPVCLQGVAKLDPDQIEPLQITPPEKEPLVRWAKLWPVLRSLLSESAQTRQPDIPKLIRAVANGQWLERIPRRQRKRWTANVQVFVDRPERTCLFNQDYNRLLEQLRQMRGETGLSVLRLLRQAGGRVRIESNKQRLTQDWPQASPETRVFILSDLGLLDESGISQRAWLKVGRQLCQAGCRPIVLLPLPARYLTAELVSVFDCISWDRNSSLQITNHAVPQDKTKPSAFEQDMARSEELLAWLSPAVRVEPALLRAVRHQLAIQKADVGKEAAAWHHEDVVPSSIGFHFKPQSNTVEKYRNKFRELYRSSEEGRNLAITIASLILNYHQHVFPSQRDEELLILAGLLGDDVPATQVAIEQARQRMKELVKAGWEQADALPGIRPYLMHVIARQDEGTISNNDFYQAVWGYKKYQLEASDDSTLPEGFDPQHVLAFVDQKFDEEREFVLFQEGLATLQLSSRQRFEQGDSDGWSSGSELASFRTKSSLLLKQQEELGNQILSLNSEQTIPLPLEETEAQTVHLPGEEITIERFVKPEWAVQIGQDNRGLFADSQSKQGEVFRWWWHQPTNGLIPFGEWRAGIDPGGGAEARKGFWFHEPVIDLVSSNYSRDEHGLYSDVEIAGVTQRFRWIEPTTFQMGSSEDEEGRYDRETQHQVTLSQGYWLADTTCTQALWQAVMGNNPSHFKHDQNPVEKVSWDDTKAFLERINKLQPELSLRLPSEAEWENACRAGTTTPFNFGSKYDISTEQVNYSGKWDVNNKKGMTKKVKSYSPNSIGLYEMHGNVFEWCEDWFAKYPNKPIVDPEGPEIGDYRVLRGGSWLRQGSYSRSAFRYVGDQFYRRYYLGFRLALSHSKLPIRTARVGQQQLADLLVLKALEVTK